MNSSVKFLSPSVIAGLPLPGWPTGAVADDAELEVEDDPPPHAATVPATASTSALQSVRLSVHPMIVFLPCPRRVARPSPRDITAPAQRPPAAQALRARSI